jgi:DNA-directed RNA polymerase subunit RPC12/RpoP
MTQQPKTVVCTSCSAKFHVPDELIRGKVVKFRCRKCGSAIDVDGRKSARPAAAPPPPAVEITAVDTPATFSQRTLPPPRPPVGLTKSSPNMHPWPEPPRTRNTHAPMSISESGAPEESLPRSEAVRDPSNRGPKIAAIAALLMAAGLSGIGLAMREAPPGTSSASEAETPEPALTAQPTDPRPTSGRARAEGEGKLDTPNRSNRSPTRVTDLPPAVDGVEPAPAAGGTAAAKPTEPLIEKIEKQEPPAREAINTAPPPVVPNAAEGPAPVAAGEPAPAPAGLTSAAVPNGPAPLPAANGPAPAAIAPPSGARAKGDFNTQAAREALEDAAGRAGKCRNIDTPSGTARVAVTFAPTGHVSNAVIESGPFVGTAAGSCVASKFRAAKVPPFSGDAVLVRKSVPF